MKTSEFVEASKNFILVCISRQTDPEKGFSCNDYIGVCDWADERYGQHAQFCWENMAENCPPPLGVGKVGSLFTKPFTLHGLKVAPEG